jgi:hypothetical protein
LLGGLLIVGTVAVSVAAMTGRHVTQPSADAIYALEGNGIYVAYTARRSGCLFVSLLNPSEENIERLKRRFGDTVCVDRQPGYPLNACTGAPPLGRLKRGAIEVPRLTGYSLSAFRERVSKTGLRVLNTCDIPLTSDPDSWQAGLRVTRQCPAAGAQVPAGTLVGFQAETELPGGFPYIVDGDDQVTRCGPGQGDQTRWRLRHRP